MLVVTLLDYEFSRIRDHVKYSTKFINFVWLLGIFDDPRYYRGICIESRIDTKGKAFTLVY